MKRRKIGQFVPICKIDRLLRPRIRLCRYITKPDDVSEIQGQGNEHCMERRPLKKLDDVRSPERACPSNQGMT